MRRFSNLLLITLISIALLAPSVHAGLVWEKTPFPADQLQSGVSRIVSHPTDPDTIYVPTTHLPDPLGGTVSPADGLFTTDDNGDSWSTLNDAVLLAEYNILDLAICRTVPDVMYAGTIQAGIFKTTDGGQSWSDVSGAFDFGGAGFPNPDWGVTAVGVDPENPDKVYISVAQVAGVDIGNIVLNHPGFFYSHDGGATWTENNVGLPPRFDDGSDGQSHTSVAGSIVVLPQLPRALLLGMLDLHVNTELFFGQTATSDGRVFANLQSGTIPFIEISTGLPSQIDQTAEVPLSLARASSSTMLLSVSTGNAIDVWASHIGLTFDVGFSSTLTVTRNKGLFFTANGTWEERNGGLPHIASWTDNTSTPDNTIRFEDTHNMGAVAIAPGSLSKVCLVGSLRCDMGDAASNNTKVYATKTRGLPSWLKNWDDGLDVSPALAYTEANASALTFNADLSSAFAFVRWTDDDEIAPAATDDGIYRLTIP